MDTNEAKSTLEAYDFKILPWDQFAAAEKPIGLMTRAIQTAAQNNIDLAGAHVVFDPLDDEDGFMLIGPADEIAKAACDHIMECEPNGGPLA